MSGTASKDELGELADFSCPMAFHAQHHILIKPVSGDTGGMGELPVPIDEAGHHSFWR
jgi:hypothetical protein